LPLSGLAGNNPASCREKNTPTPDLTLALKKDSHEAHKGINYHSFVVSIFIKSSGPDV
jgi:hypothetical protein